MGIPVNTGYTLYAEAFDSDLYFCIYEKDYEQLAKNGFAVEDTKLKKRFEIRLKNERAYFAVYDLVCYEDAEHTAFGIINRYMQFADRDPQKAGKRGLQTANVRYSLAITAHGPNSWQNRNRIPCKNTELAIPSSSTIMEDAA